MKMKKKNVLFMRDVNKSPAAAAIRIRTRRRIFPSSVVIKRLLFSLVNAQGRVLSTIYKH